MIKLFKHILLLLIITVVADRLIGTLQEYIFYQQHHGDDYITIQVLDSTKAAVIIVGSSRASHHYISDSLEHYLGLSVFNGGRDNMGIHYTKATINEMLKRHKPKFIIFDVIPYAFLNNNQNASNYLDVQTSVLLPFANKHRGLYDDIGVISQAEVWKSKLIKMYAYNSLIGSTIQNSYTHIGHQQFNGYEPLSGKIDTANYHQPLFTIPTIKEGIDSHAFTLLEESLQLCKDNGVIPVICFSPFYYPYHHEKEIIQRFQVIATSFHCQLLDYSSDPTFTNNATLFYDELHLNKDGAAIFSKKIAEHISMSHARTN